MIWRAMKFAWRLVKTVIVLVGFALPLFLFCEFCRVNRLGHQQQATLEYPGVCWECDAIHKKFDAVFRWLA